MGVWMNMKIKVISAYGWCGAKSNEVIVLDDYNSIVNEDDLCDLIWETAVVFNPDIHELVEINNV